MAVRQYIGARYVTKVYENSLDPSSAEWEASTAYEPLTLVTYNYSSYLSKKEVPATVGDPASNPSYWVVTGAYNGQIATLQQQIDENKIYVTPEQFGAYGDGTHDDTQAIQDAIDYAVTNKCKVIASKIYATTSAITINATRPNGIEFSFNHIRCNNPTGPALILIGSNLIISGTSLISDHDGIQLGDGSTDTLMNSDIRLSWLQADHDAIVALQTSSMNDQYINFYIDSIYYGRYGLEADLTSHVVGELSFYGTLFLSMNWTGTSEWAFHIDCHSSHAFTGLYLYSCSFEGCNGGVCVENTSGYYSLHPLRMFGCRSSELIKVRNGILYKQTGTGAIDAELFIDEYNDSGFDIPSGVDSTKYSINIYGDYEFKDSNNVSTHYHKAKIVHGVILPVLQDGVSLAYTAATTFEMPPDAAFITTTADLTLNFSRPFAGAFRILCRGTADINFNGSTYPGVLGEIYTITGSYMPGIGYRFLLEKVSTGSVHV